jgi:quercetin dioxygenase-like cupin family protein
VFHMCRNLSRSTMTAVLAVGLSLGAGRAFATPSGPGVTGTVIARTTKGGTDYTLRRITVPPGQSTGWHYHDGPLYAHVRQGTLSHFDATCTFDGVYPAGSAFVEPAGDNNVHIGRNLGITPLVLDVLYVLPHGSSLSEDAPNSGCDFQ